MISLRVRTAVRNIGPAKTVCIVRARTAGIRNYVNLGRPTILGNPFEGRTDPEVAVKKYKVYLYSREGESVRKRLLSLLKEHGFPKLYDDGIIKIACPCNGALKGKPCHATVIEEFLSEAILRMEVWGND